MKSKFVLESFVEYLSKNYSIDEAKNDAGTELDLAGAEELVELIVDLDIKLAAAIVKKTASDKSSRSKYETKAIEALQDNNPGKAALYVLIGQTTAVVTAEVAAFKAIGLNLEPSTKKPEKDRLIGELETKIESMSEDEAMKLAQEGLKLFPTDIPYKFRTPILWNMLSESEKQKVYKDFELLALKRGYSTKESLEKVINNSYKDRLGDSGALVSPGVRVYLSKESIESISPSTPPKVEKTYILDQEKESEVFKPNKTGANGEEDFLEGSFKQMVDNLGSIFQRYVAGEINSIRKISILTSADRYRNTGDAESLSWGQLAYARAIAMSKVIEAMAIKAGVDDDIVKQLPKLTSIYSKGENGDGTSGPNGPDPLKFGYYVKGGDNVKWVDGTNREDVVIVPIDNQGTPTVDSGEGAKTETESPLKDKNEYNQFRYNNIEIEYDIIEQSDEIPTSEKVINLKYPVKIAIPARYSKKRISIPLPSISISSSSSGKGSKPGSCPEFGESTSTSFGLTFKKVDIVSWQSDLAK